MSEKVRLFPKMRQEETFRPVPRGSVPDQVQIGPGRTRHEKPAYLKLRRRWLLSQKRQAA